jgi:hypothetical protein
LNALAAAAQPVEGRLAALFAGCGLASPRLAARAPQADEEPAPRRSAGLALRRPQ